MIESRRKRFRTSRMMQLSLGASQRLAHLHDASRTVVIDTTIADILERCRTFRTLDEHAHEVCKARGIDSEREPEVVQALCELADGGLLVALEDMLATSGAAEAVPPITTVAVITKNRPEALCEALVSYIEHCQLHDRSVDYLVCDDSESAVTRDGQREVIRGLARRHGVTVHYAGLEEKRRYAAELARAADVDPRLVDFALFDVEATGCSIGANRNAVLLHGAGELLHCADDDTVCRVVRHPEPGRRLRLLHGDSLEFWCFPSRAAALASASYDERCLLVLHEQLLGRSLSSVLNAAEPEPDYDGLCDHQLGALRGRGRIVATMTGILGDSGLHSGARLLADGGATHARLVQSEAAYRSALTSREVLRISQLAVVHGGGFAGAGFGLDLRATVPPFLPIGRAEDSVFGAMLARNGDDCLLGHPEAAILHLPRESRHFEENHAITVAGEIRFANALMSLLPEGEIDCGEHPLQNMADRLIAVGRLDDRRFEASLRDALWKNTAMACLQLEATLKAHRASPPFWAKDVEAYLAAVRESLTVDDFWLASDLREGRSKQEVLALMRRLILKFGELLKVWPELLQAARSLKNKGLCLGLEP